MSNKESDIRVRVSPQQRAIVRRAAEASGIPLSSWVRMVCLKAAKRDQMAKGLDNEQR